ncbi:hypothetical protein EVAR_76477_1 [Eumeta japonica]|uniref:Uncharacterized protein n=1 Tax=Eumeta variegata TaxID=151549 RepID=A0A4C1T7B3_EUMVA|nr:hypothetical protein EVAR_76477_1 [Eumeta japonica]
MRHNDPRTTPRFGATSDGRSDSYLCTFRKHGKGCTVQVIALASTGNEVETLRFMTPLPTDRNGVGLQKDLYLNFNYIATIIKYMTLLS